MDPSPYAVTHRYHEPLRPGVLPDWWGGAEEPLVNVTLGTEAGALPTAVGLYRAVVDAVSALPVRVLLTTGHHIDASDLGPLPPHVHVEPWVPQADVLRGASSWSATAVRGRSTAPSRQASRWSASPSSPTSRRTPTW